MITNLGVAPFSGATTGTGGRIRDVQSAGKGAHVVAGTAGYCFGNLNIPGKFVYSISFNNTGDVIHYCFRLFISVCDLMSLNY